MTGQLRQWHALTTATILVLATISTLLGLFRPRHYRDAPALVELYRTQDATVLGVSIPILSVGLWYALRGSPRGRVIWLGGLAYMSYMWANVGIQITFNELFLAYVSLFGLSLFALVGGLVTTDADAIRRALEGRIDPSVYGGFLVLIALGARGAVALRNHFGAAPWDDSARRRGSGSTGAGDAFLGLDVVVPTLLLSAAWLFQRRAWGYAFAGVVLVLGASLSVSISAMTLVLMSGDAITVTLVAALFSFLPVTVAALLAVKYVLSMESRQQSPADRNHQNTGKRPILF